MTAQISRPKKIPQTLTSQALQAIKRWLLDGKLMPGEQLSLRSTAAALDMSVMPVREAVNQLVAEHALEVTPNRAVRVPTLTAEQFLEITKIRLEIEGYAVVQACAHITPDVCAELEALNAQLAAIMAANSSTDNLVALNQRLHFTAYNASAMPMLVRLIESLWLRIGPILNYDLHAGSERTTKQTAVKYHAEMIAGLKTGDAERAKHGLHQDILTAYEYLANKDGQQAED